MKNDTPHMGEMVYDYICGNINLNEDTSPVSRMIQNEFAKGSECDESYKRMLDAYSRVCSRLNSEEWEDPDVEIIINELMGIGKYLSLKMFDYGLLYGKYVSGTGNREV